MSADRYERANALEGKPGFDRLRFLIADAARSHLWYATVVFPSWNPGGAAKCKAEAMRRFTRLREMRKERRR